MVVWTGHVSLVWKLGLGVAEEFVRGVPAALEGLVSLSDWCWAMQAFNEEVEWELSALRCGWCRPAFRRDKVPSDSDMAKIATNLNIFLRDRGYRKMGRAYPAHARR